MQKQTHFVDAIQIQVKFPGFFSPNNDFITATANICVEFLILILNQLHKTHSSCINPLILFHLFHGFIFLQQKWKGTDEQIVNIFGQCNYSEKPDYKTTYFSLNEFLKKCYTQCADQTQHQFLCILIKGINLVYCYLIF